MADVICYIYLNMGFLRCVFFRTIRSIDSFFILILMVTLKSRFIFFSWLFIVYMIVMLDVEVGIVVGWLGRVGCILLFVKSKEVKFVKSCGICIIGGKFLLLVIYFRKYFKKW